MGAKAVVVVMEDEAFGMRSSRMKRWMLRKSTTLNREKKGKAPTSHPVCACIQGGCVVVRKQIGIVGNVSVQVRHRKVVEGCPIGIPFGLSIDQLRSEFEAENVLAFLEGSDPELKDEVVVITSTTTTWGSSTAKFTTGQTMTARAR